MLHKLKVIFFALLLTLSTAGISHAFEEVSYQEAMTQLQADNPELHSLAQNVYQYATTNTSDIINKPLLPRHARNMNAFIDRKNRLSAKYFAVGTDGLQSKLIIHFRFAGKKLRVTEYFERSSKYTSWKAAQ